MRAFHKSICVILLSAFSLYASAAPFGYEARSLGMGNIGVASADIATAPFANPAMLAYQRENDDFSLLLSLGVLLNDNDGMLDTIDNFQSASNRYDNAAASGDTIGQATAAIDMLAKAQLLNNQVIAPELTAAVAVGFASDIYSMAVIARTDVVAVGSISNIALDTIEVVDPNFNILNLGGVKTTEVGLSFARNFEWQKRKVSVGFTPKIVSVESIELSESIRSVSTDAGDLVDNSKQEPGDFTTIDAGVVAELFENVQVGMVVKNLLTEEIEYTSIGGLPSKLSFDTQLRAGIAYRSDFFTVGADLDLIENDPILTNVVFQGLKTQMLSLGGEINLYEYLQLRAGMIKNIAGGISSDAKKAMYTAGIRLWLGFNLDVAVVSGAGNTLGGFVQAGFRF